MRSVLLDGSAKGRPASGPTDLVVCDDGRRALAITNTWGRTSQMWSYALDDGAPTLVHTSRYDELVLPSRNGRHLGTHRSGEPVELRDLETGERRVVKVPRGTMLAELSPDGQALALFKEEAPRKTVCVVRVADGRVVARFFSDEIPVFDDEGTAFVRTPKGEVLAVCVRDGSTRSVIKGLSVPKRPWTLRAERGGGRLLVRTSEREVEVIDAASGERAKTLRFSRDVSVLDFTAGRVLVLEGARGIACSVVEVEVDVRTELPALGVAALTPDGATVVAYRAPMLVAIEVSDATVRPWHDGHASSVTDLVWSRDGASLASRGEDGVVRVWDVGDKAPRWSLEHEPGRRGALAFSPDGQLLYALGARSLIVWELATGAEIRRHPELRQRVQAMCVSPDGRLLATLSVGEPIRLYDLSEGARHVATPTVTDGAPSSIAFGRDGSLRVLVDGSEPPTACWFDARGEFLHTGRSLSGLERYVEIDGDATSVLVQQERGITRVGLRDGSAVRVCEPRPDHLLECATEGVVVLQTSRFADEERNGTVLVAFDLTTGREIDRLELDLPMKRAVLSPDGAHLAVLFENGRVEVFALGANGHA